MPGKEEWPSEADIEGVEISRILFVEIFLTTELPGASTEEEMTRIGYSMTYDDLIEYFTMTSTLQKYKSNLQENHLRLPEDELTGYIKHEGEYRSVKCATLCVLKTTDMDKG